MYLTLLNMILKCHHEYVSEEVLLQFTDNLNYFGCELSIDNTDCTDIFTLGLMFPIKMIHYLGEEKAIDNIIESLTDADTKLLKWAYN